MSALLLLLLLQSSSTGGAGDPAAALAEAERRLAEVRELTTHEIAAGEAARRERLEVIHGLEAERDRLGAREAEIGEQTASEQAQITELTREVAQLTARRDDLDLLVRHRSEELVRRLEGSLLLAESSTVAERLRTLQESSESLLPFRLAVLLNLQSDEIRLTAVCARFRAPVVARDGSVVEADVLRVGGIDAFYREGSGEVGALVPPAEPTPWHCVEVLSVALERAIEELFRRPPEADPAEVLRAPVDVTGGLAAREEVIRRSLVETFELGGLVMYPLAAVALLAALLFVERAVYLGMASRQARRVIEPVQRLAREGRWEEASELLARSRGSAARLLRSCLELRHSPPEIVDRGIEEAVLAETPLIERALGTLGTLGSVAPLLGLLGTITGMIRTFNTITVSGSNDPALLSSGISEALITTEAGLVIAVPILLLHTFLTGRVDRHIARLEQGVASVTSTFKREGSSPGEAR
ncbi:MAG: MotA/TolQ/ExbB proton channel family protein [Planctomycetota bacterium]